MARGTQFPAKSAHPETLLHIGSFAPNGAGAVDQSSIEGPIGAVARTGVGVFEVTLNDLHPGLMAAFAAVMLNALADTDVQLGAWVPATKKLIVRVKTAGVAADIAANANNRIQLMLVFRETSLTVKA